MYFVQGGYPSGGDFHKLLAFNTNCSYQSVPVKLCMHPWVIAIFLSANLYAGDVPARILEEEQAPRDEIKSMLEKQYACWNDHNIEGYMDVYWKSSDLVYVLDSTILCGWSEAKKFVDNAYPDRSGMGQATLERLRINVVGPNTALSLEWWTVSSKLQQVRGITTSTWLKLPEGWRISEAHSSTSDLQN
jgi:ketosteroid isomerase-like protein